MRIKIIKDLSRAGDGNIEHLIGRKFDVIGEEDDGVYIKYGFTDGGYFIHEGEYEQMKIPDNRVVEGWIGVNYGETGVFDSKDKINNSWEAESLDLILEQYEGLKVKVSIEVIEEGDNNG